MIFTTKNTSQYNLTSTLLFCGGLARTGHFDLRVVVTSWSYRTCQKALCVRTSLSAMRDLYEQAPGWHVRGRLKAKEHLTASRGEEVCRKAVRDHRPLGVRNDWDRYAVNECGRVRGIQRTSLVAQTWVRIRARVTATKNIQRRRRLSSKSN